MSAMGGKQTLGRHSDVEEETCQERLGSHDGPIDYGLIFTTNAIALRACTANEQATRSDEHGKYADG